ncbi:MAG: metal ABC transporter ATP-binding protein [Proteobacteria bacterium]|nr:metal ABC transporter ATP-binding protein [Pseudomonadota bacterium]MBU1742663.1 metal ABC transporter ATP-binding protein [Pseudomonadota bacterium]
MDAAAEPIISVSHLSVQIERRPVLSDINLVIEPHRFEMVIGPNGAGKTTLLRIILGLMRPQSGSVRVFGLDPRRLRHRGRLLGYVPQRPLADPKFPATVGAVVLMGRYGQIGLFRRPGAEDRAAVRLALTRVGLLDLIDRPIGSLSGGQSQRVFIARALCAEPKLLLLDEPSIGLDEGAREQFYELLRRLQHDLELTVIMVTHDLSVVSLHTDRVVCLNRRLIAHQGLPLQAHALEDCYGCQVEALFHGHVPHRVVN